MSLGMTGVSKCENTPAGVAMGKGTLSWEAFGQPSLGRGSDLAHLFCLPLVPSREEKKDKGLP